MASPTDHPIGATSGPGAEIDDLERLRDWLLLLSQGGSNPVDAPVDPGHQAQAERWQAGLKVPGERLSQLYF
jgi:hypothetical protein